MGFIILLLGVVIIVVSMLGVVHGAASLILTAVGAVMMVVGSIAGTMGFYRRTSADQAFVKTGHGGSKVVLDNGALIIPGLHRLVEINLRTMKLGVNPRGQNALITRDNLRANVLAQFYIRVQADAEHILNAARSLGESSVNAEAVEGLVSEKLVSALRAIASQMDLFEIHTKRDEFAERVKEHVRSDLESNGLLLESVTISELDQTDPGDLSDNNVFDAQGKRKITEITAAAAVERNTLERNAEQARKQKDVETRQEILGLERKQAEFEAQQATEIAKVRADKERESQEAVITQQRQVELAKIEKEKQLQAQEIGRQQAIETLRVQQEQAVQTAGIEKEKAISLAGLLKQIAVAEQETARAKTEEAALNAAAERERASQQVTTVTQLAEADREANKKLISSRQEIEQGKMRQQTAADVEAYTKVKQADAEREASEMQAQAKLQLAEADAHSREVVAKGERAQQMVAVDVARELVNVEQAKVAVERQQLENRQQFAEAGIHLEIHRLSIQANRDVQIEFAKSLANFLASGHMTLYGTPETATAMLDNMAKGFGLRAMVEGFVNGPEGNGSTPLIGSSTNGSTSKAPSGDAVGSLLGQVGGLLQPALARLTNGAPSAPTADDVAKRLAEDPALLAALRVALDKAQTTEAPEEESDDEAPAPTRKTRTPRA